MREFNHLRVRIDQGKTKGRLNPTSTHIHYAASYFLLLSKCLFIPVVYVSFGFEFVYRVSKKKICMFNEP